MPLDPQTLGARLRQARENRGLSQQKVAEALKVPRPAVSLMESGERAVTTLELSRLADLYGRDVVDFFGERVVGGMDPASGDTLWAEGALVLPRMLPDIPRADPAAIEQVNRHLDLCQEGFALEELLGTGMRRDGPPAYQPRPPRNTAEAVVQGAQVAGEERRRLGLGNLPLADLPGLLTAQGVWACGARLPDGVSGLFLSHAALGVAVLVNSGHGRARRRFSYAHEYAHVLLDRERRATISSSDNHADLVEKRANAFAAAFLLPPSGVEEALRARGKGQSSRHEQPILDVATEDGHFDALLRPPSGSQTIAYQDVAILAHRFGVSYQAATHRLRSLDLLTRPQHDFLLDQVTHGRSYLKMLALWEDLEGMTSEEESGRELRNQVLSLAIEAYRREEISRGRLLEIAVKLGLSSPQVAALAEAARGTGE